MSQDVDAQFRPQTFTVADPRSMDGDPYEVAERAVRQAHGVALILSQMMDAVDKMACNAEMERAFAYHEEPRGSEWDESPQGRRFKQVREQIEATAKSLAVLAVAAGYNPKNPPKDV
jgi:hypothetical protein